MPTIKKPVSLAMNQFLLRVNDKVNPKFLFYQLKNKEMEIKNLAHGAVTKTITKDQIRDIEIKLPKLEIQNKILEKISEEYKIINLNRNMLKNYKSKMTNIIHKLQN